MKKKFEKNKIHPGQILDSKEAFLSTDQDSHR